MTAFDPQTVREVAEAAIRKAYEGRIVGQVVAAISARGTWNAGMQADVMAAVDAVVLSWPDEQPQDDGALVAELNAANADNAAIADRAVRYRKEVMRLRARVRELEAAQDEQDGDVRAVALGERYRLSHGGAYCTCCHKPMREGTTAVRTTAALCAGCADGQDERGAAIRTMATVLGFAGPIAALDARDAKAGE